VSAAATLPDAVCSACTVPWVTLPALGAVFAGVLEPVVTR